MVTAIILMFQLVTFTQDTTGFPSSKGTYNNPIIISETSTINALRGYTKTPISQKTVEKKDIEKTNFGQEMPFQLSKTPSITFQSDGGSYMGYSYFRLRGIDQTRINMTLNGIPLNEPEDEGAYFSNYGDFMSNIQSFQVQRGVGISSNGVASYGGSVNFLFNTINEDYIKAEGGIGSFNSNRMSISISDGLHNGFGIYGKFTKMKSDGFRYNSGYDAISGFFNLIYSSQNDILQYISFYGNECSQMAWLPSSIADINIDKRTNYLSEREKDKFEQWVSMFQYTHKFDDNFSITIQPFINSLVGNYVVLVDDTPLNFNLKSNWYGISINSEMNFGQIKAFVGIHGNNYYRDHFLNIGDFDKPKSDNLYYNTGEKWETSAFIKMMYETSKFHIFVDGQIRNINFNYIPEKSYFMPSKNISWSFFNPRAGITYDITDNISIYSSLGMTRREPTRTDMFAGYDDMDTVNISEIGDFGRVKPEQVINIESGLKLNDESYKLDINYFHMQFSNEIAPIGQLSYISLPLRENVKSSFRHGIEVDGSYYFDDYISVFGNFTFMDAKIAEYGLHTNVTPLLTPKFSTNFGVELNILPFDIFIINRFVSKSFLDNENTQTCPSYYTMDVSSTLSIESVILKFQLNNIFDKTYFTGGQVQSGIPYYFVQSGRNFFITLSLGM